MVDRQTRNVLVVPQNKGRFAVQAKVIGGASVLPALTFLASMAFGEGTSEGLGAFAIPVVIALLLVPALIWWAYRWLSLHNGLIWAEDGDVYVQSWTRRQYQLSAPRASRWGNRLVLSDLETALVVDPKQWEQLPLRQLLSRLPGHVLALESLTGMNRMKPRFQLASLRQEFRTFAGPFRILHEGLFTTIWSLLTIAYIAAAINIAYLL